MGHDESYEKIISAFLLKAVLSWALCIPTPVFLFLQLLCPLILLARSMAVFKRSVIRARQSLSPFIILQNNGLTSLLLWHLRRASIVAHALVRPARKLLSEGGKARIWSEFSSLGKEFTRIAASLSQYTSLIESTTGGSNDS